MSNVYGDWKTVHIGDRVRMRILDKEVGDFFYLEGPVSEDWNEGQVVTITVLGRPFSSGNYHVIVLERPTSEPWPEDKPAPNWVVRENGEVTTVVEPKHPMSDFIIANVGPKTTAETPFDYIQRIGYAVNREALRETGRDY